MNLNYMLGLKVGKSVHASLYKRFAATSSVQNLTSKAFRNAHINISLRNFSSSSAALQLAKQSGKPQAHQQKGRVRRSKVSCHLLSQIRADSISVAAGAMASSS